VTPEARGLRVVDRVTGAEFQGVVEVDADAGWLVRLAMDGSGLIIDGDEVRMERLEGLGIRIDIDVGVFGGGPGSHWQEWNPRDTADGITELHELPTCIAPSAEENAA
jgi:hypothetical protein